MMLTKARRRNSLTKISPDDRAIKTACDALGLDLSEEFRISSRRSGNQTRSTCKRNIGSSSLRTEQTENDELSCSFSRRSESLHKKMSPLKPSLRSSGSPETSVTADCDDGAPRRVSVIFYDITIHEFQPTLGDNPSCNGGPPLSLSWNRVSHEVVSVSDYEERKNSLPRRHKSNLCLDKFDRREILLGYHSITDIYRAENEVVKIQKQRQNTRVRAKRVEAFRKVFFRC